MITALHAPSGFDPGVVSGLGRISLRSLLREKGEGKRRLKRGPIVALKHYVTGNPTICPPYTYLEASFPAIKCTLITLL